jgi:hypothetical protein
MIRGKFGHYGGWCRESQAIGKTIWDLSQRLRTKTFGVICTGLFCGILYAGLKPFRAPPNEVAWVQGENALRFGEHGTVFSPEPFPPPVSGGMERTIEFRVKPGKIEDSNTLIAFYDPASPRHISIRQSDSDLVVYIEPSAAWHSAKTERFFVPEAFRDGLTSLWAVAFGESGTTVYRDGVLAVRSPLRATRAEISGQLIVSGSPIYDDSWSGVLSGVAIYDSALNPAQVARHYANWTNGLASTVNPAEHLAGLYLFREHSGTVIRNATGLGHDLYIPEKYMVLRKTLLDPVWRAFGWDYGFWKDAAINVGGFVPVGCFFCAWFSAMGLGRPALRTVALGAGVSLFIEVTQKFLPSRDSSMADLINNTLGSMIGAAIYRGWAARTIDWGISRIVKAME